MKTVFRVFSVEEKQTVTSVSLSSDGLTTENEWSVIKTIEDEFKTELEAIKRAEELVESCEFGVEIVKMFVK